MTNLRNFLRYRTYFLLLPTEHDAEENTSVLLNRGRITDMPLLRSL